MRRKDREMSAEFGLSVIDHAPYGVLSVADGEATYAVPLSPARVGHTLYVHSAKEGHKMELLADGTPVRVVFVSHVGVPTLHSDDTIAEVIREGGAGRLLSQVFTTEFSSAVVRGRVYRIHEEVEPDRYREGLYAICAKYTPDKMQFFEAAFAAGKTRTAVFAISIDEVTAKRKKFGRDGKELKWQAEA